MASAQVMAMPVDTTTTGKRHEAAAAADTGAEQDVYVKLKSLQKHMEFLDIQVGARLLREKGVRLPWVGCLGTDVVRADLSISVLFLIH